jgi:multidrug efflux system membrane fusion protein
VAPGAPDGRDVVIASGLSAGERVVTDGQLRLVPGARVDVKAAAPSAAPGAAPGTAPAGGPSAPKGGKGGA